MKYILLIFTAICLLSYQQKTEPILFEPNLISDGGVFGLTISPDSKTAFWVKSNGKRDTLSIMESEKIEGKWTQPKVASFSTSMGEWKDIDPVFSPDGKTLLFQSNRPVATAPHRKGFDIWKVRKLKNGWSKPYHLGNTINTDASESYASITKSGTIYFMKETEKGNSDIYFSEFKNGEYQEPKNIGMPINTENRESNPFISPKEDYIIYFSDTKEGYGEVDLYISFKKNKQWTTPQNLGAIINSEHAEFCPFVHQKEKRLYFSRQIKQENRMLEDFYYIDFDSKKYKLSSNLEK